VTADGLEDAVAAVTKFLVAEAPLGETLQRVAGLALRAVPSAVAVGVSLRDDDETAGADGPGLFAHSTDDVVLVEHVSSLSDRWPALTAMAADNGLTSTLSTPLVANQLTVGDLAVYATAASPLPDQAATDLTRFAEQAAVVLANARSYWAAHDLKVGLQAALDSRAVIDMAKGKLMAQNDIGPDDAFALLVRASQRENVKLREIAQRIVHGDGKVDG
jgi:GAF domain-containing protein